MRNKLKGLVFLCMAVALPLTAQNVYRSGSLYPDEFCDEEIGFTGWREGSIVFSHL